LVVRSFDFRSSALFPLFVREGVTNRLNFLSYWKFKNKLEKFDMTLSFREHEGRLVNFKEIEISGEPKAYDINLKDGIGGDHAF
jgi:hypothetical protein